MSSSSLSSRFVRPSKFRHVYGHAAKRDQWYDDLQISQDGNDSHLVRVNSRFLSVHWSAGGGGSFLVQPLERAGRIGGNAESTTFFNGHSAPVLDTDFHPFNDHVIASAGEDGKVMLWNIPEALGVESFEPKPVVVLTGHERRIVNLAFNPTAENLLASASHDLTVRLWDIEGAACRQILTGTTEPVLDQCWNWTGSLLATTSRDKHLRVYDIRAGSNPIQEVKAHDGVKGIRIVWLGDQDRFATTGFSRQSDRQFAIWELASLVNGPLKLENLDTSSGLLLPYYDPDTRMLYLGGKGDGNIRYYEVVSGEPYFHPLSEYKSSDPQRGLSFLPKHAVNVAENEVARAYKIHNNAIEPISFRVPRRSDEFQRDIFPETRAPVAIMTVEEYFAGKEIIVKDLPMLDLKEGFTPASTPRAFSASAEALMMENGAASTQPSTVEEYKHAYTKAKNEIEELKSELSARNIRIRQLEAQLKQ